MVAFELFWWLDDLHLETEVTGSNEPPNLYRHQPLLADAAASVCCDPCLCSVPAGPPMWFILLLVRITLYKRERRC